MKIVYLGSGEFGIECLNLLKTSTHNLAVIVTGAARRAGRGRKTKPTAVGKWAKENSVKCIEADDVNKPDVTEKISEIKPDLIVVIAFGQKIGKQLINLPASGAVNVHSSLLPKYRGAAPINWAIIKGERKTGISIITLAEKMDAGDILSRCETEIGENQTAGQLHDKLAKIAAPLLLDTIEKIERGQAVYTPQDDAQATMAPKLKKSDGFLDFTEPADVLRRKILGFWPWPGASAIYQSKQTNKKTRVTIAMAEVVKTAEKNESQYGLFDEELNVICGRNSLRIKQLKPAGSSLMSFTDFVNGHRVKPADALLKIEK